MAIWGNSLTTITQKIQSNNIFSVAVDVKKSAQLSTICREHGETIALKFISKIIQDAGTMMKSEFDSPGILATAQAILLEYKMLPADEIIVAIQNGMMERYGKVYGGITFPMIFEWLKQYWIERQQQIDAGHENNKSKWGNNSDRICQTGKTTREVMYELKIMKQNHK